MVVGSGGRLEHKRTLSEYTEARPFGRHRSSYLCWARARAVEAVRNAEAWHSSQVEVEEVAKPSPVQVWGSRPAVVVAKRLA